MKHSLLVIVLLAALPAIAEDTIGEHVVRTGETLQSITAHYLGNSKAWQENWKLNPGLANPHRLLPGQRLRVIVARTLPAQSALIRRVARRVEKKPEPEPWTAAHAGDRLGERHGVHTFAASSAELQFDDQTRLTLTEESLVFLRASKPTPARDRSTIEIVDGHADLEKPATVKRAHDVEIVVGTTVATPADPAARARFRSAGKKAQVMSYRGATAVASGGASVQVGSGMGVSVPEGEKPPAPEKLLAAPSIDALDVSVPRPRLRWAALNGAKSYAVEICRDRGCAEMIARVASVEATEWRPADALPAGSLFWRLTARSASGLDGYPAVAPLLVRRALSGSIKTDGNASAGVKVALYRDEHPLAVTHTGAGGTFVYADIDPGRYKVIVDSRSIHPTAWAEEVAPHPGGLNAARADDASSLAGAEHVVEADVAESPIDGLDFAFSFGAVTHAGDDGQGSLRQFIRNANAVPGPNAMRYFAGVATIRLASLLPRITESTTIAGRSRAAEIGSVTRVGMNAVVLDNPSVSELTIDFAGADVGIDAATDLTISDVVLTGAKVHVRAVGRLTADNVVVGQLLDRRDAAGLEIAGDATLRRMLVTGMGRGGIIVQRGARVDAEHIEVSDCGDGVTVASPGSRIRHSLFLLNTNGVSLSNGNVVEASTFRGNRTAAVVEGGAFEPGDNELDANILGAASPGG